MVAQESISKATRQPLMPKTRAKRGQPGAGSQFWGGWIAGCLSLLMLPLGAGCQSSKTFAVNEAMLVSYRDMVWARRAYNLRYGNCDRPYGEHYYNGFCAGYAEVANGSDGYVPALPPNAYRTPRFQSADGAQCVNAWFEGYPAGVAAAKQEKVGNFNNVLVSKMIDTAVSTEKNTHRLLPSDVPVTQGEGTSSEAKPEVSAPPKPDMVSSIMMPNMVEPLEVSPAKAAGTSLQPMTPSLPPIVTGSGIVRVAEGTRGSSAQSSSNPSANLKNLR